MSMRETISFLVSEYPGAGNREPQRIAGKEGLCYLAGVYRSLHTTKLRRRPRPSQPLVYMWIATIYHLQTW